MHEARGERGKHLVAVGATLNRKVMPTMEKIWAVRHGEQVNHGLTTFGIRNEHSSTSGRAFCKGSAKSPE